ncbi:MAG TPA: aspartate ammonia-lyase [Thermoanaerobaculia bacterium]|nr:aspartate ammonia-lyase [Thermoanaerobaculia bacterium]
MRIERDTLGEVRVPDAMLYGAQTQRAVDNYPVSGLREHPVFIHAFVILKKAAALANHETGAMPRKLAEAIANACDRIIGNSDLSFRKLVTRAKKGHTARIGDDDLRSVPYLVPPGYIASDFRDHFVVDVFQAGAGTSFNMNCNEVIANLANKALGGKVGSYKPLHPNDHINMSQSTNDAFPTATRLATLLLLRELFPALDGLIFAFDAKGEELADVIKSGRTHLQDAVPVTLGQEFHAWAAAVRRATKLLEDATDELRELGIGGTATGTGLNAPPGYRHAVVRYLSEMTKLALSSSLDLRESMQSQLPLVAVSAALRNLALELTRIANDLRLLASGPHAGLAEIALPAAQPGSSIMPGKVNPSMLECLNQICFHIISADAAVAFASQAGQLELNVMMPLMAFEILFSIAILKNFLPILTERCIRGITADRKRCEAYYTGSPALATVLNPLIGYERAAEVAKESVKSGTPIPELLRKKKMLSEEEISRIFTPAFLTGQADRE